MKALAPLAILFLAVACGSYSRHAEESQRPSDCKVVGRPAPKKCETQAIPTPALGEAEPRPSGDVFTPKQTRMVKRADEEPLSTFSVDVDTASYSFCRRVLREGRLPDSEAVRVEEFINYFEYGDPAPVGVPFSVATELAAHPFAPDKHLLRIGLQGKRLSAAERKPLALTFLVDVSGSMQGPDRLPLVKRSLAMLLASLRPCDTVALCTYAGRSARILGPTPMSRKGLILEAIEGLSAQGATAMSSGLDLAYACAAEAQVAGAVNRVIVCSDGDANVGGASHEDILERIAGYKARGITLSTIGFGVGNYKDVMMEQLADKGDGNASYIDDIEQARRVFQTEVDGTLQVIAKDVKIQVEMGAAVESYRLIGYENRDLRDEDFRDDKVDAGEIGAGHRVTALYDLTLREPRRRGNLATVRVRFKDPEGEVARELEAGIPNAPTSFAAASPAFRFCAAVAGFAEILRGSPHADGWRIEQVEAAARSGQIPNAADRAELLELLARTALSRRPRLHSALDARDALLPKPSSSFGG